MEGGGFGGHVSFEVSPRTQSGLQVVQWKHGHGPDFQQSWEVGKVHSWQCLIIALGGHLLSLVPFSLHIPAVPSCQLVVTRNLIFKFPECGEMTGVQRF